MSDACDIDPDRDDLRAAWAALRDVLERARSTPILRLRCAYEIAIAAAEAVVSAQTADSASRYLDALRRFELARTRLMETGLPAAIFAACSAFSRAASVALLQRLAEDPIPTHCTEIQS